jgi:hypothetical protein
MLLVASTSFAEPICGVVTKLSIRSMKQAFLPLADYGVSFTLSTGESFHLKPQAWTHSDDGSFGFADPIPSGMVALLSASHINDTSVCYDSVTQTLSME